MNVNDDSASLLERVNQAAASQRPLQIQGGGSKRTLGCFTHPVPSEDILHTTGHSGIIAYEPTELVISARTGTPLQQINAVLSEAGQMLPFDPPERAGSTLGGVLACGWSGPRRPFNGSARDYVLGMRIINGQAQDLSFGGDVMKNVAGYDVSRVQVGAWGTLGVLLDVSLKVLPKPEAELTLRFEATAHDTAVFSPVLRQSLPLSGAMLIDNQRYLRLSGSESAVRAAALQLGGEEDPAGASLWDAVRDHRHAFFTQGASERAPNTSLWRLSLADYAPPLKLQGSWLYEWAGAQRWLLSEEPAEAVFAAVAAADGHAMRYSEAAEGDLVFQPLVEPMRRLQSRLRDSFDPARLFNRGRFHPELDGAPATSAGI